MIDDVTQPESAAAAPGTAPAPVPPPGVTTAAAAPSYPPVPQLSFEEARVFGALIEKSQATPEYYPLTLNALTNACNQKSSREPVTDFDEDTVEDALESLREKGLVAFASGTGRALKYVHRAGHNGLALGPAQACVISILLLRGPQTPGELRARAGRQFNFADLDAVQHTIETLMAARGLVEEAPRRAGQKEQRYRHLFFEYDAEADAAEAAGAPPVVRGSADGLRPLVEELVAEVRALRDRVAALEDLMK